MTFWISAARIVGGSKVIVAKAITGCQMIGLAQTGNRLQQRSPTTFIDMLECAHSLRAVFFLEVPAALAPPNGLRLNRSLARTASSGFRLEAPAPLTPPKRLKLRASNFKGSRYSPLQRTAM